MGFFKKFTNNKIVKTFDRGTQGRFLRFLKGKPGIDRSGYDQRSPDEVQWDPDTGMPIGLIGPPDPGLALAYQQRANEVAAQHNAASRNDAQTYLAQGVRSSETFRPGGYGAVASGLYSQRANAAFQDQIDPADMMAGSRDFAIQQQNRAQKQAQTLGYVNTAVKLVAAYYTGGASLAVDAAGTASAANNKYADTSFDEGYGNMMSTEMDARRGRSMDPGGFA